MATPKNPNARTHSCTSPAVVPLAADTKIMVELTVVDALAVGHSLRTIARKQSTPPGTADAYGTVGNAMVAAAHEAIRKATAPK